PRLQVRAGRRRDPHRTGGRRCHPASDRTLRPGPLRRSGPDRRDPAVVRPARRSAAVADAVGLLAGYALDAVFGGPRRLHPVAGYGRLAGALERRVYEPRTAAGARYAAIAVGVPVLAAGLAAAATRRRPVA